MSKELEKYMKLVVQPKTFGERVAEAVIGVGVMVAGNAIARSIAPNVEETQNPDSNLGTMAARTYVGAGVSISTTVIGLSMIAKSFNPDRISYEKTTPKTKRKVG